MSPAAGPKAGNGDCYDCVYVAGLPCASWRIRACAAAGGAKTLNPITSGPAAFERAAVPSALAAAFLGVGALEPGAGVDRFAALSDLEIQLRAAAAPAVTGRGD